MTKEIFDTEQEDLDYIEILFLSDEKNTIKDWLGLLDNPDKMIEYLEECLNDN